MNTRSKRFVMLTLIMVLALVVTACGGASSSTGGEGGKEASSMTGKLDIDGSSTVYPLTEAIAEEFNRENPDVRIAVGVSGTGGGFKRFANGEIPIANASRHMKDKEKELATTNGVEPIELSVAYDGLSVIVSKDNTWVDKLTVDELKAIFEPGSKVKTWADVRAGWPNEKIKIYSPGADSGTFDYFTETINGEAQASRNDEQVTFSEDDNNLVQGVAGDKNAIGYFGFAYFEENKDKLKAVPIDNGKGAIAPTYETVQDGSYAPLSRPLFVYVDKGMLQEKPEVKAFMEFYLNTIGELAQEVGYIALPQAEMDKEIAKLK